MAYGNTTSYDDLSDWKERPFPPRTPIVGDRVRLEPVSVRTHGEALWNAASTDDDPNQWTWLAYGPFADRETFLRWLADREASVDPQFFAIVDAASGAAQGMCSIMRIDAANGVLEIGHIWFGPQIQRSTLATEAIFLLQQRTFDELGYRRLEWKCDNANQRSKRAAERFGFTPEGVFRKHSVVKGHNRDTAWFSLLDDEWSANKAIFEAWLAPENFDEQGRQRRSMDEIRTAQAE